MILEPLLDELKLLLSVSAANLDEAQIESAEKASDILWNKLRDLGIEHDMSLQEYTTTGLITLIQLLEFVDKSIGDVEDEW